jgi:hypothetical protein
MVNKMKYQKTISVDLEHKYYVKTPFREFRFELVPLSTDRKRTRPPLTLRPQGSGFVILNDIHNQKQSRETKLIHIAAFPFNPLFSSYSNLDIDYKQGRIYFVGNTLSTTPQTVRVEQIALQDQGSNETFAATEITVDPQEIMVPVHGALLDFSGFKGRLPAFIMALKLDKKPPGESRFMVGIAGRTIPWYYHFYGRSNNRELTDLLIKTTNNDLLSNIGFERQSADQNQREAVFCSTRPIALREKGYREIELYENKASNIPLIPHLPNAGVSSLHYREDQWLAQIVVNI